jgi:hypothetical protein
MKTMMGMRVAIMGAIVVLRAETGLITWNVAAIHVEEGLTWPKTSIQISKSPRGPIV